MSGVFVTLGNAIKRKISPPLNQRDVITSFQRSFMGILSRSQDVASSIAFSINGDRFNQNQLQAFQSLAGLLRKGVKKGRDFSQVIRRENFKPRYVEEESILAARCFDQIRKKFKLLYPNAEILPAFANGEFTLATSQERTTLRHSTIESGNQVEWRNGIPFYQYRNGGYRVADGPLQEVTRTESPDGLAERLGVKFITIEGGRFKYQGRWATIDSYDIAETPFTIRQMLKLLAEKGDEVRAIFTAVEDGVLWDIDKVISESRKRAARGVPEDQIDDCPLVCVSQKEAEAVAKLSEARLLTEQEWERAASGTNGLQHPWARDPQQNTFDPNRPVSQENPYIVANDKGTRPVKSKEAGKSVEGGVYDLIGLVWEWTSSWYDNDKDTKVLRGGSWLCNLPDSLRADYRYINPPDNRLDNYGFRLARTSN